VYQTFTTDGKCDMFAATCPRRIQDIVGMFLNFVIHCKIDGSALISPHSMYGITVSKTFSSPRILKNLKLIFVQT